MDQLLTIHNLSIAGFAKSSKTMILKNFPIQRSCSTSYWFCLTKIAMDELNQEQEYDIKNIELSKGIEASRIHADRELLDNQQREYEQCLEYDLHNGVGN